MQSLCPKAVLPTRWDLASPGSNPLSADSKGSNLHRQILAHPVPALYVVWIPTSSLPCDVSQSLHRRRSTPQPQPVHSLRKRPSSEDSWFFPLDSIWVAPCLGFLSLASRFLCWSQSNFSSSRCLGYHLNLEKARFALSSGISNEPNAVKCLFLKQWSDITDELGNEWMQSHIASHVQLSQNRSWPLCIHFAHSGTRTVAIGVSP